jgi:ATP-binding cassette subfamily F protein 3
MAAITIRDLTKSYAGQTVLDGVTLSFHKGEHVGLIGANGCGKTTLLRTIIGAESPDRGRVTTAAGLQLGYLPQRPELPGDLPLIDAVRRVYDEHHAVEAELHDLSQRISRTDDDDKQSQLLDKYDRLRARFDAGGGYDYEVRIREVLGGLGFAPQDEQIPVGRLSGGQQCRAALACLLLADADYLLLDEPTNHLDITATQWLEKYLANFHGGVVIISHDRYLLDRVVTKIVEIEGTKASVYPTNYTHYAEAKRIRMLQARREYARQRQWLAHQRDYIDRTRYAKDSAKQARARQKMLDRMAAGGEILDRPAADADGIALRFTAAERGGEMLIRCEQASKAFGDVVLIKDLDFEMTRGERVGIIGPNGVGKTTLLRMLLGRSEPTAGAVRLFENVRFGYLDQDQQELDPDRSVIETIRQAHPPLGEAEARSFLALFLFRGDDVFKPVGTLSGGERSRVVLAMLVARQPNLLILDEPTNHLDIPASEALEAALKSYPGGILIVSHDRYFLDRVVDRLLVLPERGRHEIVLGNWTAYAELVGRREAARQKELAAEKQERAEQSRRAAKKQAASGSKSRSKYAAARLEALEAQINECEVRIRQIEASFSDPATMKDADAAKSLSEEYEAVKARLDDLNQQWNGQTDAAL